MLSILFSEFLLLNDVFLEPVQYIVVNIGFVELVEHLVTAFGIKFAGDILKPSLAESLIGFFDTFSVFADRIRVAGHEINGFVTVHFIDIFLIDDEADAAHHIPEQAVCGNEAAKRIGDVLIHGGRIA